MLPVRIYKLIISGQILLLFIITPLVFADRMTFICKPFGQEKINKVGPCYNKALRSSENLNEDTLEDFIYFAQGSLENEITCVCPFKLIVFNFLDLTPLRC